MAGIINDPKALAMSAMEMDEALTRFAQEQYDMIGDDSDMAPVLHEAARRLRVYEDLIVSLKHQMTDLDGFTQHQHNFDLD